MLSHVNAHVNGVEKKKGMCKLWELMSLHHQIVKQSIIPKYAAHTPTKTDNSRTTEELPSVNLRAINLRVSSKIITGIEIFNTAIHSATLRGVIWKMV